MKMIRSCISCKVKKHKYGLLRFTVVNGWLVVDHNYKIAGRGVYCCMDTNCIHLLMHKDKQLARALRSDILLFDPDKVTFVTELMKSIDKN